jgi:hypothetical protein
MGLGSAAARPGIDIGVLSVPPFGPVDFDQHQAPAIERLHFFEQLQVLIRKSGLRLLQSH